MNDRKEEIKHLNDELLRRQINYRGPRKVGDAVNDLLARRGYARMQDAADQQQAWTQAVGQQLAADSRVGQLRCGVFEIIVRNSAVLQELTFQKRQIIRKLAGLVEGMVVKDVRFRVGVID